ncbi:MAG TPA: hypothetical protein VHI10_14105 [Mycobacterium sp.]|nr:hypothetical protein [Mycobacterium sp.]
MGIVGSRLPCYLVEWYWPGLTEDQLDRTVANLDECAAMMSTAGCAVRLLVTIAMRADEVLFGVFAASSEQAVAQACDRAGVPAERLAATVDAWMVAKS